MKKILLIIVFLAGITLNAQYQASDGTMMDKIVAIVGNEIITLSDVNAQVAIMMQSDKSLDFNNKDLRKKVIDAMINEKLIVTKAIEDSVVVSDDEINQGWEEFLANAVRYYGSEKRIEDIYGMSIQRMKSDRKDDIRKQLLAKNLFREKFGNLKISPREIEEFYNAYKDSIPEIPDQVELYHIVKNINASKALEEDVVNLAVKVRDSLLAGGDFADFAKRYSKDPGSANSGGEFGWSMRGRLVKEFENVAFSLLKGEISKPVKSPFGYHLIQTLDKNKDSVRTRHILFRVGTSDEDKELIKTTLKDLKLRVEKGESFEDLAKKNSDEKETQGFGGSLGKFPISQIPASIKDEIEKLKEGGVSDPKPYGQEPKPSFHIMYKKRIIPAHKANLKDDYKELEQFATQNKQSKATSEWIEKLRKDMYWEIKND